MMKRLFLLIAMIFCMAFSTMAFSYEDAFESIKGLPHMKGVEGTMISGGTSVYLKIINF